MRARCTSDGELAAIDYKFKAVTSGNDAGQEWNIGRIKG